MQENINNNDKVDDLIRVAIRIEQQAEERLASLKKDNPAIFAELDAIDNEMKEVDAIKASVKRELISDEDFDTHDEFEGVSVSVTKVARLEVYNIDQVPEALKEVRTVANEQKALNHYKLSGEVPEGFVDKSYYRLTWRKK